MGKKLLSFLLVLSIVSTSFLPVFTPKAEAFLGVGDFTFTINVKEIVRNMVDAVAMHLAQKMVDEMVRSSINWANNGFEGSPAFVSDPGGYFTDIANSAAGEYINNVAEGNLCTPFRPQITLSLQRYYADYYGGYYNNQCTFTGITGNLENFFNDFSAGGWQGWFSLTQNSSNNPYSAYLDERLNLDSAIAKKVGVEQKKIDWGQGFKSKGECLKYNPAGTAISNAIKNGEKIPGYNPAFGPGECIEYGPDKTPGSVIKSQLDKVLPSGLNKLISVEHVEQLISAFSSALLTKYVFSPGGLTSNSYDTSGGIEDMDIDGDEIPDGLDYDNDGKLDYCHHGEANPDIPPSNTNCIGSKVATNSPYYAPLCSSLDSTTVELQKYLDFLNQNTFKTEYANTWTNKTLMAGGAIDDLAGIISQFGIQQFDPALFTLGKYTDFIAGETGSLAKDRDLKKHGAIIGAIAGGSSSDSEEQALIKKQTTNILKYLQSFRTSLKNCDNPDIEAAGAVTAPSVISGNEEAPSGTTTTSNPISCSPNLGRVVEGESVVWTARGFTENPENIGWYGDDIESQNGSTIVVQYNTPGVKNAGISVLVVGAGGEATTLVASCAYSVVVSPSSI